MSNAKFNAGYVRSYRLSVLCGAILTLFAACNKHTAPDDRAARQKIGFDLERLDEAGLFGPPDGKVAIDYEFCIPAREDLLARVTAIDSTARRLPGRGRIGCTSGQWLVVGNTHQPRARQVLLGLARLAFVERIEANYWE